MNLNSRFDYFETATVAPGFIESAFQLVLYSKGSRESVTCMMGWLNASITHAWSKRLDSDYTLSGTILAQQMPFFWTRMIRTNKSDSFCPSKA